jgi:5-methylcytosine-specific restriction protein A
MKRAPKLCNAKDCTKLVYDGSARCEDHPTRRHGWGRGSGRTSDPEWQAIRQQVLQRDNYRCQIRGPQCEIAATQVDHITPVYKGGTREPSNLRGSCPRCHSAKTSREGHEAKKAGKVGAAKPPQPARRQPAKQSAPPRIPRTIHTKY